MLRFQNAWVLPREGSPSLQDPSTQRPRRPLPTAPQMTLEAPGPLRRALHWLVLLFADFRERLSCEAWQGAVSHRPMLRFLLACLSCALTSRSI